MRARLMDAAAVMGQGLLRTHWPGAARIETAQSRLSRTHPQRLIDVRRQSMDDRLRRLDGTMRTRLLHARERSNSATLRLEALSPLRVLARGYSIVQRDGGKVITGPSQITLGEPLTVRSAGGAYGVVVKDVPD